MVLSSQRRKCESEERAPEGILNKTVKGIHQLLFTKKREVVESFELLQIISGYGLIAVSKVLALKITSLKVSTNAVQIFGANPKLSSVPSEQRKK